MPQTLLAQSEADLFPPPGITTLLFDWDGTLFDNHSFNFRALKHGLEHHGLTLTEDWFHEHSGFSAEGIVDLVREAAGSSVPTPQIIAARDTFAAAHLAEVPLSIRRHEQRRYCS